MHPNTKPTIVVLSLCMGILGVLLLPLPYAAYGVLKFILSLGLFYTAGFFMRPCKNLLFTPSADRVEVGTRNPTNGVFSGTLRDSHTNAYVEDLTDENSELVRFLENSFLLIERKPLPPISLKLSLGLVLTAVMINPITHVHLPRTAWMLIDVLILAMLGWALNLIREENAGNRPHVSLTRTVGQPPEFPFMSFTDVLHHARRLWPVVLGVAFAVGLLASQVGGEGFEDFSLTHVIYQTLAALVLSAILAVMIQMCTNAILNKGVADDAKREQVPGEFLIGVFLLIFICCAFGGFFTPPEPSDSADAPAGYIPHNAGDDY